MNRAFSLSVAGAPGAAVHRASASDWYGRSRQDGVPVVGKRPGV